MDEQEELPTVEQLEAELKADPSDVVIKEDLAYALVDRCFYGPYEEGHEIENSEADLTRVRQVVADLPDDMATWPRGYLAYLDEQGEECIAWMTKWALVVTQNAETPLNSDELYVCLFEAFAPMPEGLLNNIAKHLWKENGPNLLLVLTLRGYADTTRWQLGRGDRLFCKCS